MYEQINRGLSLKELIPHPLDYAELESLAERCSGIIDSNIKYLRYLLGELEKRDEADIRDILRSVKGCIREIDLVEYFGISALIVETKDIGYLNKLVRKIHKEMNLPVTPPSVTCIATRHYFFHALTNVIFVPVGETRFLLHLPDLFHEIGHEILFKMENELRLKSVYQNYNLAVKKITEYYRDLLARLNREIGPKPREMIVKNIHYQWKTYWLKEFFCDLFAIYILGPAYAWAHFHLTTKKYENVYEFSPILPLTHPSDESRLQLMLKGLKKLGFEKEAHKIITKWNQMPFVLENEPVVDYYDAYPTELLDNIATLFLEGLKKSNFNLASKEILEKKSENIMNLLNQCWKIFWGNPQEYIEWETKTVQKLKSDFGRVA